ncbi:Cadmium, cobalt and zinc/H(+)-K(+) antiporter [Corynebacterium pseudotuberculosis]|nr:Cadmium, cobalt and zinc/H(+)-K(+) antiporter [Corynebacterium pseudotuberculosis 1/06-A]AKS13238.1 Cadmium, cobalt and zinc/H(+)-K(+) antiporter [Corynebacterium pseudotuberculosis]APQ53996.1 Cadmium, cobalt and zinc/H(+)-K(+) antiporter [Corynebacterium pseudotuberculosis]APQ56087.1 Cadmium, cobalt and zinc/H(+)-K(+) antiporter [Corynebacterium pseudotuberculosis]ATB61842.1 Cadmium, cobalt and zinc/H(+)-K(+) antiporter [Corynebacterium pseudotuberculosis]
MEIGCSVTCMEMEQGLAGTVGTQSKAQQLHNHGPGHSHEHGPSSMRALLGVVAVTSVFFLVELIGGLWSGSLALLSDAMHMLSDFTGVLLALAAMLVARRPASMKATFGNKRIEVVSAFFNALAISIISVWIVVEAIQRLGQKSEIDAPLTLSIGLVGLLANMVGTVLLHGHKDENINVKGAYLHIVLDMVGSIAVIVSAVIIYLTSWLWVDTVASLAIAALILPRSLTLAWNALGVLLERAPVGYDLDSITAGLLRIRGVIQVHDLHLWTIDGHEAMVTCHLVVDDQVGAGCGPLDAAQDYLKGIGIVHATIQIEERGHDAHEDYCRCF